MNTWKITVMNRCSGKKTTYTVRLHYTKTIAAVAAEAIETRCPDPEFCISAVELVA